MYKLILFLACFLNSLCKDFSFFIVKLEVKVKKWLYLNGYNNKTIMSSMEKLIFVNTLINCEGIKNKTKYRVLYLLIFNFL